jgi:MFS family permease
VASSRATRNSGRPAAGRLTKRSLRALDWSNFFLSDVRVGVGPYLGIYLAMVIAQTPAGALIDATTHKRPVVAAAALVVAVSCGLITVLPSLAAIVLCQVLIGVAAAILGPGIAGLTLGLVGYRKYSKRQGRNEVFNHADNLVAAAMAGLVGQLIGLKWLFYAVAMFAVGSVVSVLIIRKKDVETSLHAEPEARSSKASRKSQRIFPASPLLSAKSLLMFALSVVLFHFANAAMLPLAGQYMTEASRRNLHVGLHQRRAKGQHSTRCRITGCVATTRGR